MLPSADRDLTERLFADLLPGSGPVARVRDLEGGSVSRTQRVSFADPATPDVVLKLGLGPEMWTVRKEFHAYGLLAAHGIGPIPKALASAESVDLLDGGSCLVMELLPGTTLAAVRDELTSAQMHDVYKQLGALLARIHAIAMPAFGFIHTDVVDPLPDNVTHMAGSFADGLSEYRRLGGHQELADAVAEIVDARAAAFAECTAPVLCHGDAHEDNVLVVPGPDGGWTISGLIDPANLHAGDPLVDLVRTDAFAIKDDEAKLSGLLAGYGRGGDRWPPEWAPRMYLYRILLALELRNWFTGRQPEYVPGLDEELRALVEASGQSDL